MNFPFSRLLALVATTMCLHASTGFSQDATPVVVTTALTDFTVNVGSGQTVIKLNKTFGLSGITGKIVRFSTTEGTIDVGLLKDSAPNTVATFLSYADATSDNASGVYSYQNTLIQRAVPSFIIQGGGFYVDANKQITQILGRPAISSEAGIKNTRGTLAMALSTGPNSATGDWFFNIADNAMLDDTSDGGPFTVFGRVVAGMSTLDAIIALPQRDFTTQLGAAFANVPLVNFDGTSSASVANLVYLNSTTQIPLTPKTDGGAAVLKLKVKTNTNPGLVTAQIIARKLYLTYAAGQTGAASITVMGKNPSTKSKATTTFTVTVQ